MFFQCRQKKGIITDISGGGLRLIMNKQYEKDTVVAVKFTIAIGGGKRDMYLPARIILSFRKTNDESVFDNRLQFINIKSEDTEDIVKYVFEQQRFMRQKERECRMAKKILVIDDSALMRRVISDIINEA